MDKKTFKPEIRFFDFTPQIEVREDKESRIIKGYAAKFDKLSKNLGWFREKIDKNAFDEADMNDVVAVLNHDFNILYARTLSGTLKLSVDDEGLLYEFDSPNSSAGNDLVEMINRKDISSSSFQFIVSEDKWEQDDELGEVRTILKVKRLIDVSPVTFPAYPDTTVAKRSFDESKQEDTDKDEMTERKIPASVMYAEAELELRKIRNH